MPILPTIPLALISDGVVGSFLLPHSQISPIHELFSVITLTNGKKNSILFMETNYIRLTLFGMLIKAGFDNLKLKKC